MFKIAGKKKDEPKTGDHVKLKGLGLTGYSGTIIEHSDSTFRYYVRLDPGQMRLGHTTLQVMKFNLIKDNQE